MSKSILILTLVLGCLISHNLLAEKIIEQRLNYQIILPNNPTKVQCFAADELKRFLHETYSRPIKLNGTTTDLTFVVGTSAVEVNSAFIKLSAMKKRFGIFRHENRFLFTGDDFPGLNPTSTPRRQAGTLTAVYYFLNKYVGVNFFFPGKTGYTLAPNKTIKFTVMEDIPSPSFTVRSVSMQNQGYSKQESTLFFRRLLGNLPYWSRHDYYYTFLYKWQKRFAKKHPEYFGLYAGKRVSKKYPFHVPCFSNPAVMKQVTDDIVALIKANSSIKTIRIFADCPIQFCQCEKCLALPERKYIKETKQNGEMVYGIVKKIMNRVHKIYPNVQFLTQTKQYTGSGSYFNPPVLTKLGAQCTVELLVNRALPYFDHSNEVKLAEKWQQDGAKLVLKSYERYSIFKNYPIIKPHLDQQFFKLFLGKVAGTRYSGTTKKTPYSFCALNDYLQLKLLFNINTNIDAEMAKFCAFAYPGAEKEMVAFYRKMEELFAKLQNRSQPLLDTIYTADKLSQPMQLLDRAAKKVNPNSKYFQRLYSDFKKFYTKAKAHSTVH